MVVVDSTQYESHDGGRLDSNPPKRRRVFGKSPASALTRQAQAHANHELIDSSDNDSQLQTAMRVDRATPHGDDRVGLESKGAVHH